MVKGKSNCAGRGLAAFVPPCGKPLITMVRLVRGGVISGSYRNFAPRPGPASNSCVKFVMARLEKALIGEKNRMSQPLNVVRLIRFGGFLAEG